jgi:hypothetical protein
MWYIMTHELVKKILDPINKDLQEAKDEWILQTWFFVLKPDWVKDEREGHSLLSVIIEILDTLSIEYHGSREIILQQEDIYNIYPHLNLPSRVWSTDDWKGEVLDHMMSWPICVWFITEKNALKILGLLKIQIREARTAELPIIKAKIKNLIHTPDHDKFDELESNKKVILKHITQNNPNEEILKLFNSL